MVSDITGRRELKKVVCEIAPCSCGETPGFGTLPIPLGPLALGATVTPSKDLEFSMRRINHTLQGLWSYWVG